jgi:hypothetical protein
MVKDGELGEKIPYSYLGLHDRTMKRNADASVV